MDQEQYQIAKDDWDEYGFFMMHSDALGEAVLVYKGSPDVPGHLTHLTMYTFEECLELVDRNVNPDDLRAIHMLKKKFKGTIEREEVTAAQARKKMIKEGR